MMPAGACLKTGSAYSLAVAAAHAPSWPTAPSPHSGGDRRADPRARRALPAQDHAHAMLSQFGDQVRISIGRAVMLVAIEFSVGKVRRGSSMHHDGELQIALGHAIGRMHVEKPRDRHQPAIGRPDIACHRHIERHLKRGVRRQGRGHVDICDRTIFGD